MASQTAEQKAAKAEAEALQAQQRADEAEAAAKIAEVNAAIAAEEDDLTAPKSGQVTVRSARTDDRVAFYEKNPLHPDGQAFVAGRKPVTVAKTAGVEAALATGRLVKATG